MSLPTNEGNDNTINGNQQSNLHKVDDSIEEVKPSVECDVCC